MVGYTMLPQIRRIENEIRRKLLGRNHGIQLKPRFNMDTLLRGDILKRFQTYEIGIPNKVLTPNDARMAEGLPKVPGGDKFVDVPAKTTPAAPAAPAKKEQ
jgi:phage portal protein BeeE